MFPATTHKLPSWEYAACSCRPTHGGRRISRQATPSFVAQLSDRFAACKLLKPAVSQSSPSWAVAMAHLRAIQGASVLTHTHSLPSTLVHTSLKVFISGSVRADPSEGDP